MGSQDRGVHGARVVGRARRERSCDRANQAGTGSQQHKPLVKILSSGIRQTWTSPSPITQQLRDSGKVVRPASASLSSSGKRGDNNARELGELCEGATNYGEGSDRGPALSAHSVLGAPPAPLEQPGKASQRFRAFRKVWAVAMGER